MEEIYKNQHVSFEMSVTLEAYSHFLAHCNLSHIRYGSHSNITSGDAVHEWTESKLGFLSGTCFHTGT